MENLQLKKHSNKLKNLLDRLYRRLKMTKKSLNLKKKRQRLYNLKKDKKDFKN